ncbi:hypothetical protein AMECASPLE_038982 [Ameca splendens]|uniref:Uncharacterized protein n=1 Tax=Ameca splendens TaxID=208324 RepID=A0ABV1A4J8_9TELE
MHWRKNKEHNPHSAAGFVQMTVGLLKQMFDGIFNSNSTEISKLKGLLIFYSLLPQVSKQKINFLRHTSGKREEKGASEFSDLVEGKHVEAEGCIGEVEDKTFELTGKLWVKGGLDVCLAVSRRGGC